MRPSSPSSPEPVGSSWTISLNTGEELRARLLIDASGRGANLARRLGAHILVDDHLTCRWLSGRATGPAGLTIVEAVEDGGWYTAPLHAAAGFSRFTPARDGWDWASLSFGGRLRRWRSREFSRKTISSRKSVSESYPLSVLRKVEKGSRLKIQDLKCEP